MKESQKQIKLEKQQTPEGQWQKDNADALRSLNEYVRKHGLPLEKHRQF
ncbi:type II toxin-antitoxin system CcdA family antitoxin [Lacibacterium aquatile]|uniref:Type II toxin-antitoxin system CcdA family antitoxin n=1 Tax=Lacibacterium aquatile TaxID=1168082 RepID=A0ABW5DR12_9PROT